MGRGLGFPIQRLKGWGIAAWLAVVNTGSAFTLWNHSQRLLPATESSVIINIMLIQIALLAWIFLGKSLGGLQINGSSLLLEECCLHRFDEPVRSGDNTSRLQILLH